MGSVSVSSCRCIFVSCVHHVAVLNAAFCMTCTLLMLVDHARRQYGRGILQIRSHNCLIGNHECLLQLPHPVDVSAFIICSGL